MLLQNLRARMNARLSGDREAGFTLIELLVVMLILGILAAIAIPAFFNQRDKGTDAQAKAAARTAQTSIETWATENGGSYADADSELLHGIEDTLVAGDPGDKGNVIIVAGEVTAAKELDGDPGAENYAVASESDTGAVFMIARAAGGAVTFACAPAGGGCPADGDWSN